MTVNKMEGMEKRMNITVGFNTPQPGRTRPNIRVIPARNPYRALTSSSGYPATFGAPVSGSYLVIRDDQENSSSWP